MLFGSALGLCLLLLLVQWHATILTSLGSETESSDFWEENIFVLILANFFQLHHLRLIGNQS